MLFVNNLHQNGSHEQKLKYLPNACNGTAIGGMCMSEPGAGTDVMGMSTTATLSEDGKHYFLNGMCAYM
jgi:isovaleryl-CoA dehydrogenase